MLVIDYQDRRPIYEQLVERLEMMILRGVLNADEQLPSVRKLAAELSINPNTIQKAYSILEMQGYIYPVKGRGNFVSDKGTLLKEKKEQYWKEYDVILEKGKTIGITMEEFKDRLMKYYAGGEGL